MAVESLTLHRLHALLKEQAATCAEARRLWLPCIVSVTSLRKMYGSDADFEKAWAIYGSPRMSKRERNAFIWMGHLPPGVLEAAMANCVGKYATVMDASHMRHLMQRGLI